MLTRSTTGTPERVRRQAPTAPVLAVTLLLALSAGCSSSGGSTTASPSSTPTTASVTAAAPQTPDGAPGTRTRTADGSPRVSVTDYTGKKPYTEFSSPSGNINCVIYTADSTVPVGARCDVSQKTWNAPAKPGDCELDWGQALTLRRTAGFGCVSDAVVSGQGTPVLPYGHAVKLKTITCVSEDTGMTCTNSATGHGFTVSRTRYSLF